MTRRRTAALILFATLSACSVSDSTAPPARSLQPATTATSGDRSQFGQIDLPGGTAAAFAARHAIPCNVPQPLFGSATIGPKGGIIDIGPHRFVVPRGSLSGFVTISGHVPAGNALVFDFEPTGLKFQRPAFLVIDVSACQDINSAVVHVDEIGGTLERIEAAFVDLLHLVIAPIEHFSSYALDV